MRDINLWLDLLCCPKCRGDLRAEALVHADEVVISGSLVCAGCAASYPIIRGVPRFATDIQAGEVNNTVEGFGYQWTQANPIVKDTAFSAQDLFLDFIAPVTPAHFQEKVVLDGGCGLGRFTLLSQQFGASRVVGLDLSSAVEAAFANTKHLPNVLIIQGDLLKLPLKQGFDYAFSVGVLHHTADPKGAFSSIVRVLKPNGSISAWVYGRENNGWIIHVLNPLRQHVSSRLPRPVLWAVSYALALPLYALIRLVYLPVERAASLAWLRKWLFYFDYLCWLGKHCNFRETALVIFDHLVPEIAEYIPRDEFEAWFTENALTGITITSRANNSWRGFAHVSN